MPEASSPSKTDEETLADVLKDFKSAWEYCSGSWHKRWQDNYSLYNNVRVKRGYEGISDTFVPMVFGTIETLVSALFGMKPKFNYIPPQDRQDQKTDVLNGLVDFFWDKDQWSIKVINTGRTGLQLGTGIDFFYWDGDHPCMLNVPLRDYFRDPTAPGNVEPRYQGRRYLTTKAELEGYEVVDLDAEPDEFGNYPMKKKFKNLDKVVLDGSTGDPLDKEEKDMWYGSTVSEAEKKQVEVIEYWTNDKVISVANRQTVIQDDENPFLAKAKANGVPFPKGLVPFNWFRDYVDPSLFYAKGEIDFIGDQQEDLNDLSNQYKDAITYALNPMFTLDPSYAHLLSEIESLPGAGYPVAKDALNWIVPPIIPNDVPIERQNIKSEIRETTASNEVVRGAGSQAGTDPTATEINAQVAGAGQRINLKVTQIENEYFQRMAKIVFELIKLYVTEPMMVRILGKDGARWEEFDPSEFQGEYEPRVQLDISIENKKREDAANAKELLAAFLGDMDVNQQELKKLVLQRSFELDPDEVELLMQPAGMGMPPPEMMAPPESQAPPNPAAALFGQGAPAMPPQPMPEGVPA